jgi:16S rRNA (guanine527-N7)-methyltransferase
MPTDREIEIREEFLRAGLPLNPSELEKFVLLDRLLLEKTEELDLTRIESGNAIIKKHYIDSAIAAEYLMGDTSFLMDLGTGAGFPGIPIAIRRPGLRLLRAEPRLKKLSFLDEAIGLLGLENVELYPHKVGPRFDRPVDGIISRDFLPLAGTLELCSQILKPGNRLYLMKGQNAGRQLKEAAKIKCYTEFTDLEKIPYTLDSGKTSRFIVHLRKKKDKEVKDAIISLPSKPIIQNMPKITEIASSANARLKSLQKLLLGKNIKKSGEALVSGRKIVKEILEEYPHLIKGVLAKNQGDFSGLQISEETEIILLRPEVFPLVDPFGTGPPILLINTPEIPEVDLSAPFKGIRLLVPFQDPANVGSIIRTAGAMGAGLVLLQEAANPFHPKALRASGPLALGTDIFRGPSLSELPGKSLPDAYALSARGEDIYNFRPASESLSLVMGLEGPGLDSLFPPEKRLRIPMTGKAESLNASVAAAMALAILGPAFRP